MKELINRVILSQAKDWLQEHRSCRNIVLIVDQIDRTPQRLLSADLTNHVDLFLHNEGVPRSLDCHVVYAIPIEPAYSRSRNRLRDVCLSIKARLIKGSQNTKGTYESKVLLLKKAYIFGNLSAGNMGSFRTSEILLCTLGVELTSSRAIGRPR